jgi:hypothetical protein
MPGNLSTLNNICSTRDCLTTQASWVMCGPCSMAYIVLWCIWIERSNLVFNNNRWHNFLDHKGLMGRRPFGLWQVGVKVYYFSWSTNTPKRSSNLWRDLTKCGGVLIKQVVARMGENLDNFSNCLYVIGWCSSLVTLFGWGQVFPKSHLHTTGFETQDPLWS